MSKRRLVILGLSGVALLLVTVVCFRFSQDLNQVPRYLDRTDAEQAKMWDDAFSAMVKACEGAGGQWIAGFSNALCTVDYPEPSMAYTPPTLNPARLVADNIQAVLWVLVVILPICSLLCFGILGLNIWERQINKRQQYFLGK